MELRAIFAGFGGQGIVLMGTLLAQAGMKHGRHVTFYPSYGAAMRGGTANCSVIVAEEPIASPIIASPNVLVVMNDPSLDVFLSRLAAGGTLLFNSALIQRRVGRADVAIHAVPANTIAEQLGDGRMANMAMLGALIRATAILPLPVVEAALVETFGRKGPTVVERNTQALRQGYGLPQLDSPSPMHSSS